MPGMNPIKSLLSSDHGLLAVLLVVGATVLAALGHTTWDQWLAFAQWIFGIFVGGHAVISVGARLTGSKPADATAPASTIKQVGSTATMLVLLLIGAAAVGSTMSACSATAKAKETAIENGFVDCSKAQASFGDIVTIAGILRGTDAETKLGALALQKGEAVVACTVKDAIAVLFPGGVGAQPTAEVQRGNAYLALKGYKFR